jgi:hypothetical protein
VTREKEISGADVLIGGKTATQASQHYCCLIPRPLCLLISGDCYIVAAGILETQEEGFLKVRLNGAGGTGGRVLWVYLMVHHFWMPQVSGAGCTGKGLNGSESEIRTTQRLLYFLFSY